MENTCITDLSQIITLKSAFEKDGRNLQPEDLSIIDDGAIIYNEDEILWLGSKEDIPTDIIIDKTISKPGHILTPALVDSHTHLVFGGDRSFEYSLRLNGADYQKIAKAGGGILNTMESTLQASEEDLFNSAVERIEQIYSYGVKTIEIKSGYALAYEGEKKLTNIITKLKKHFLDKVQIVNTFMAAHAIPKKYSSSDKYLEEVVIPLMTELKADIDCVDIFHEEGYFSEADTRKLFKEASELGLPCKIHADEFNDNKGAIIAAEYKALSADHLLCTTEDGIKALANSSTVATILPGTAFFLGKPLAQARRFLDAGAKVALASDYNPGSCHCDNLLLIASISAKSLGFNIAELWSAMTLNASHALGLKNQGVLTPGMKSSLSLFECESVDKVTYHWGKNFNREI